MNEPGRQNDPNTIALSTGGKTSRVLRIGETIGESYRLKGLLGRGGMGYVFRVEHTMIGRDYALKMLAPDQINEITWNRFQSEGKAIAKLDHPNIVKIYNMGVDQGCPYYVMDILEGMALSDCIADKMPLTVDDILDIFIQLADGFGYAHSRGIIHRDVKPSNVMLVDGGGGRTQAKVVDFGIAKVEAGRDVNVQSMTRTGEIFGSPYYMSPEQCLGTEIDHRSDIYSLGCTLFEALCGNPPFVGESAMQTVLMHQSKESPTIESVGGKYSSEEMESLVAKMLMKRPADRYQSMYQVRHDLERIRQRKGVGKNVETGFISSVDSQLDEIGTRIEEERAGGKRHNYIVVALLAAVFLLIGTAGYFWWKKSTEKEVKSNMKTISSEIVSSRDMAKVLDHRGERIKELESIIRAFGPITSSVGSDGLRVFRCPDVHLGTFCWGLNDPNKQWLDFDRHDEKRVDAFGTVKVPADKSIFLKVEQGRNLETYQAPAVLASFGPQDIAGIKLISRARMDELSTDQERAIQFAQVAAVTKALSGWTNLTSVEFSCVPATREAMANLDSHKELRQFGAFNNYLVPQDLAERPFLRRIQYLSFGSLDNCDPIFKALKGSRALTAVTLLHSGFSPEGIKSLATCPNLKGIRLIQCPLNTPCLEAISTIKGLELVVILESALKPDQIPVLAKYSNVRQVELFLPGWPDAKVRELHALMPRAKLIRHLKERD